MSWLVVVLFALTPAPGVIEQTAVCESLDCVGNMVAAAPFDPRVVRLKVISRQTGAVLRSELYH